MTDDTKHSGALNVEKGRASDPSQWQTDQLLFRALLLCVEPFWQYGHLKVRYRDTTVELGSGPGDAPTVVFQNLSALWRILKRPDLAVGETYVDGEWDVENGDLAGTLGMLLINDAKLETKLWMRAIDSLRVTTFDLLRANDARRSRKNASHHYDIGNDLYEAFLDDDMVYSCAFFSPRAQSLEAAQQNKLDVTLDRLSIEPGMEVLDIGCGWGAMTRAIARRGAKAVGVTLADQQLALARERVPAEHADDIAYHLQDYRDHAAENADRYDRVVSIGMFEHVGPRHFVEYFDAVRRLLKPGGRAVIHSIVKKSRSRTNAWIEKYIFPGGFIPRIEDMSKAAEAAGLVLANEPFVHESTHYATTLRHWHERFEAKFPTLDKDRYDERFRRMWKFYLAGSEAAFDALGHRVAQLVIEKP